MRRRRSGWSAGHKVELFWWETPAIALHPCPVRARVSRSSVPMCWPENWPPHPGTIARHLINTKRRCVRSLRSIRTSPHDFDQHAAESRDCNIDQVPNREAGGLEINADHRSDFEIDEQEENVSEARAALGGHADESRARRPNGRRANCK